MASSTVRYEGFRDKSGRHISSGDLVVYGHAISRHAGISFGKVVEVKKAEEALPEGNDSTIRVRGVEDDYRGKPRLNERDGLLSNPSRVLKINRTQVPDGHLALLDDLKTEHVNQHAGSSLESFLKEEGAEAPGFCGTCGGSTWPGLGA